MAFPFIKFPTFAEFIERLRDEHNILFKDLDGAIAKEGSAPISIHFLEGTSDGKTIQCVVDIQDYDDRITPSMHRSICARFGLNQECLGAREATSNATGDKDTAG